MSSLYRRDTPLTVRAFYYSEKQQFVGLAGKPNSVNDFNALSKERSGPNGKLAGICKSPHEPSCHEGTDEQ
jgi:hypothetical protein